jgi:hypothetical protein
MNSAGNEARSSLTGGVNDDANSRAKSGFAYSGLASAPTSTLMLLDNFGVVEIYEEQVGVMCMRSEAAVSWCDLAA